MSISSLEVEANKNWLDIHCQTIKTDTIESGGDLRIHGNIEPDSLKMDNTVNKISVDPLMLSDSDSNLVSEKAIKTYVDNSVLSSDEWIRTGTTVKVRNVGDVVAFSTQQSENGIDNISVTNIIDATAGIKMNNTVDEISTDVTMGGATPSNTILNTQASTKSYIDSSIPAEIWTKSGVDIEPIVSGDNIINVGNIIPETDNSMVIGSSTKRLQEAYFIDPHGTQFTVNGIAAANRRLRSSSSVVGYIGSYTVVAGVWTYTITDTSGLGCLCFTIDQKVLTYPSPTLSCVLTSYAGTDLSPNNVYVYVINNGSDIPELVASNTNPEAIEHADVAYMKAGSVSVSSVNLYSEFSSGIFPLDFLHSVYNRFWQQGSLYIDGLGITSTSTDVTIATGDVKTIFDQLTTLQVQVSVDGMFYIDSLALYNTLTSFSFTNYADGGLITNNRYFNVVLGIITNGTTRIMALVCNEPVSEYLSVDLARNDTSNSTIYTPADSLLKNQFIPVCRVIIKKGSPNTLQLIGSTYHIDIRGTSIGGGGGGSVGISDHSSLTNLDVDSHPQYATLANRTGETLNIDTVAITNIKDSAESYEILKPDYLLLKSTGSVYLVLESDTDSGPDNDNAVIKLSQDNNLTNSYMRLIGTAGTIVTGTKANSLLIKNTTNTQGGIHFAINEVMKFSIYSTGLESEVPILTDIINEYSSGVGTTIEGVLCKDESIRFTNTTESTYPGIQIQSINTDYQFLGFDMYYDGNFKSSHATSNFYIFKDNDKLYLSTNTSATAQGSQITGGFTNGLIINNDGTLNSLPTYGNDVGATTRDLLVDDSGNIGYQASIRSKKEEIKYIDNFQDIYKLKPCTFKYKKTTKHQYGLIAEDVETVLPEICYYNKDKELEGVKYSSLIIPMLSEIQNQKKEIDKDSKSLSGVLNTLDKLYKLVTIQQNTIDTLKAQVNILNSQIILIQNK